MKEMGPFVWMLCQEGEMEDWFDEGKLALFTDGEEGCDGYRRLARGAAACVKKFTKSSMELEGPSRRNQTNAECI